MTIQKVSAIYFSPTGTTKSVLKHILTEFDIKQDVIDLTLYENRNNSYLFNENELVLIGIPVYGGRVPSAAENRIKRLKGNNTPAVLIATYGNRQPSKNSKTSMYPLYALYKALSTKVKNLWKAA